jgi:predicted nucleic acid-binding protein
VALRYLLDTGVLKRLDRSPVRDVVQPLVLDNQVGWATICDLEVGYSARNADEWDGLIAALNVAASVETTAVHVRRALQVQRLLASRSQRGRKIPDLLLGATAEDLGLTVLHYDADFDLISAVTGQPCQWVVPRGSAE